MISPKSKIVKLKFFSLNLKPNDQGRYHFVKNELEKRKIANYEKVDSPKKPLKI